MAGPTVVSLKARPWQVSLLSFEIGGILESLNVELGDAVTQFDFATFYGGLNATAAGDLSRFTLDLDGILNALEGPPQNILAALRSETRGAALDRLINARQNAYFSKYGATQITDIVTAANKFYGGGTTANPAMLAELATLAQTQADQLAAAYLATGRGFPSGGTPVVVQNTSSFLTSKTNTIDASTGSGQSSSQSSSSEHTNATGRTFQESVGAPNFGGTDTLNDPPAGGQPIQPSITDSNVIQDTFQEGSSGQTTDQTGRGTASQSGSQQSTGTAYAVQTEQIVNTDYTFRISSIESQAQNLRAQISLNDQQFALLMSTQNLGNLATVLQNELGSIDLGVYQTQLAFMSCLLLAPINGIVTGMYKNPGDAVRPGEPVLRVEDNSQMLLVMKIVYSGPIKVATTATPATTITIQTSLFDASALAPPLTGTVVLARGGGGDDVWDLVVKCVNPLDASGDPVIPIGYNFDYDNTTIVIS